MSITVITREGAKYDFPRGEWYEDVSEEGNLGIHHGHDYEGDEVADNLTMLATFAAGSWAIVHFYDSEPDEDDE